MRAEAATRELQAGIGESGGTTRLEVAVAHNALAELYCLAVDLSSAERACGAALLLLSDLDEPDHPVRAVRADALIRRGHVRRLQARHEQAAADLHEALRIAPDGARRAEAHNELGVLCKDAGEWHGAAAHYECARQLVVAAAEPAVEFLAALEHNLAGLAHARGQMSEGIEHVRRALALRTSGPEPPAPAALLSDRTVLAALLAAQQQHGEAEALLRQSIDGWTRLRGARHYEVGHARHHLAALLHRQGKAVAAREQYCLAAEILSSTLGPTHPEVLDLETARNAAEGA